MVGVAGRSKGCYTCKKRKIACGLQRPQCAQCLKSNRLCTGYQRQHVFIINQDLPNGNCKAKSKADELHPADTVSSDTHPDTHPENTPLASSGTLMGKQKKPRSKPSPTSSLSSVPAYRQMLFDCFLRSYIPYDELGPSSDGNNWLTAVAEILHQPPALATAMLAISLSKIGKLNHDEYLGKESLKHYTLGLRELQRALYDPEQMYTDETLAACLVLSIYELIECPGGGKQAYATHQNGCARLLQLRGPKAHRKGLGHSLFLSIRIQSIFQALDRHSPTFLTDTDWLESPWENRPKAPADRLVDYLAQAPGIFGATDRFSQMQPVDILITALSIIERCWTMDAELADFYLHLDNSIPGPLYWPELSTMENPADDEEKGKVFPVSFHFFNLRMAATLMLFWAQLCMMYRGMTLLYYRVMEIVPVDRKLVHSRSDTPELLRAGVPMCPDDCECRASGDPNMPCIARFDMTKLRPLGIRDDFLTPARNVCQSVEYCLQKKMLDMGPGSIAAPLNICLDTIKEYPYAQRELEWGRHVMKGLEERLPYLKWVRK